MTTNEKFEALMQFAESIGLDLLFVLAAHEGTVIGIKMYELTPENQHALATSMVLMAKNMDDSRDLSELN